MRCGIFAGTFSGEKFKTCLVYPLPQVEGFDSGNKNLYIIYIIYNIILV